MKTEGCRHRILPLEGQPHRPFLSTGFCKGFNLTRLITGRQNTGCISYGTRSPGRAVQGAQPEQSSPQEKGMRALGLLKDSAGVALRFHE